MDPELAPLDAAGNADALLVNIGDAAPSGLYIGGGNPPSLDRLPAKAAAAIRHCRQVDDVA